MQQDIPENVGEIKQSEKWKIAMRDNVMFHHKGKNTETFHEKKILNFSHFT